MSQNLELYDKQRKQCRQNHENVFKHVYLYMIPNTVIQSSAFWFGHKVSFLFTTEW